MNVAIIGAGYVGLVTGACLAQLGNKVICADNDSKKIAALNKGVIPIYEPGLGELIKSNKKKKRLSFVSNIRDAVRNSEIIFIAVGTPSLESGEADLTCVEKVSRDIARSMDGYRLIVEKSTVPVKTCEWVRYTVSNYIKGKIDFDVASNPEFLREGSAISDFMRPDRIVIGVDSKRAKDMLLSLYRPLNASFVVTDVKSAELIKHASNAFLAAKISFINAISRICDMAGADVEEVARGMGLDKRIGSSFLNAGIGYGGSCFPKDLDAFINISDKLGYDFELLKAVRKINKDQGIFAIKKIKDAIWGLKDKDICVLGLSFKPDTDDIRNAPSLSIIKALQSEGARIKAYDPQAMGKAKSLLPKVKLCRDAYDACRGCDCLLVVTEWDEFKKLDFAKVKKLLRRPIIIDGRNIYDPEEMKKKGFIYIGIGR